MERGGALVAMVILLVGCSGGPSAAPAPSSAPAPASSALPAPTTAPLSAPATSASPPAAARTHRSHSFSDPDVRGAVDAYSAMVHAFNTGNETAYFGAFDATLLCFYGTSGVARESALRSRWHGAANGTLMAADLYVIGHDTGEVTLLDRGFFRDGRDTRSLHEVLHQKISVLRRIDGAWRIVAETNEGGRSCVAGHIDRPIPAQAFFERCRTELATCAAACPHDIGTVDCAPGDGDCERCAFDCQGAALVCIGVDDPPPPAHSDVQIRTEADVARFVTLSARYQHDTTSLSDADSNWLAGAQVALGAPYFHVVDSGSFQCVGEIFEGSYDTSDVSDISVTAVHCALDATQLPSRCVASLLVDGWDTEEVAIDLTLLFDGPHLRVVHHDPARVPGPAAPDLLDRYGATHPPEWSTACPDTLVALVEDRVGDDFFEVRDADDGRRSVQRLCGEAARYAVRSLGTDWSCAESSCGPVYECGNSCDGIAFDAGRVLAHYSGETGLDFTPADATLARQTIACGQTGTLPSSD